MLLRNSGYETEAVGSAEEALGEIRRGLSPHIVLVDMDLPGMNGIDLIERLEQLRPCPMSILVTATTSESLRARLKLSGIGYLRKPILFEHLLGLISTLEAC